MFLMRPGKTWPIAHPYNDSCWCLFLQSRLNAFPESPQVPLGQTANINLSPAPAQVNMN